MTRALLFVGWLLLNGSLSAGHLLIAALLAWTLPALARGVPTRLHAPVTALRLALTVLWDIGRASVEVARSVLGPESALRPGFVRVPLDLHSPQGIAVLAGIVTLTPGTVSADIRGRHLLVHALHNPDGEALVGSIKTRYETPLREIFDR